MNFIHRDSHPDDRAIYFEDEPVVWIDDTWDMADIAVSTKRAPSRNQAIRNGWSGPIPPGWTCNEKNKRKPFWILNKGFISDD